jgi:acyl-CoA thioester hydrolase
MTDLGVDLVVAEANVRYRDGLRFDEEVDLVVTIAHLGNTSMITKVDCVRVRDEAVCAECELRQVFVRLGTAEKTAIPDEIRAALEPYAP